MNKSKNQIAVMRVMGCESTHYGSMEKYLEELGITGKEQNFKIVIVYENIPQSIKFVNNLKDHNITLLKLKMRNKLDLFYLIRLYKLIRMYKIDIIHSYFSPTCHYVGFLGKLARIKTLKTSGNLPLHSHLETRSKISLMLKIIVSIKQFLPTLFLDRLICISAAVKNEFKAFGVPVRKLVKIQLGINLNIYQDTISSDYLYNEFNINRDNIIIGTVGRLEKQKNHNFLLDVINEVAKKYSNIKLIIVGDGTLMQSLKEKTMNLGLEENVIFAGRRSDVQNILKVLDIFVFPSLYEGMGNALLEAMAMSKPCVVSNIPVFKEIITHNVNGFLSSNRDVKMFSSYVIQLIEVINLREQIGTRANKTIAEQFTLTIRVNKILALYKKIFWE